jgi:hypothetical protein
MRRLSRLGSLAIALCVLAYLPFSVIAPARLPAVPASALSPRARRVPSPTPPALRRTG